MRPPWRRRATAGGRLPRGPCWSSGCAPGRRRPAASSSSTPSCASCSWVRLLEGRPQAGGRDVGVALRRGQAGVAEDLLDAAQVRTTLEEVGRGGVAQRVRRHVVDAREGGGLVDDRARLALVEAAPAQAEEDGRRRGRVHELRAATLEPRAQRGRGGLAERDDALLVALADDAQRALVHV